MKFHGFALGHIEVEVEGRACDLHNFYVARAIHYELSSDAKINLNVVDSGSLMFWKNVVTGEWALYYDFY